MAEGCECRKMGLAGMQRVVNAVCNRGGEIDLPSLSMVIESIPDLLPVSFTWKVRQSLRSNDHSVLLTTCARDTDRIISCNCFCLSLRTFNFVC